MNNSYCCNYLKATERCVKFVLIVLFESLNTLVTKAIEAFNRSKLPIQTIIFENGLEFTCHEYIIQQLRSG